MDGSTLCNHRQLAAGGDINSPLGETTMPFDAHLIQQLRSMILAILDEPMVDKSSNVRFFRLPDRRILASLLESRPLQ